MPEMPQITYRDVIEARKFFHRQRAYGETMYFANDRLKLLSVGWFGIPESKLGSYVFSYPLIYRGICMGKVTVYQNGIHGFCPIDLKKYTPVFFTEASIRIEIGIVKENPAIDPIMKSCLDREYCNYNTYCEELDRFPDIPIVEKCKILKSRGKYLYAVKYYREKMDVGLREAKEEVDLM